MCYGVFTGFDSHPTLIFLILGVLRVYFSLLESYEQSQKNDWSITKVPLRFILGKS